MPAVLEATMPRKKSETGPKLAGQKLDSDLVRKAKLIAADRGVPAASYLSAIVRPTVEKDWAKLVRKTGLDATGEA